MPVSFTSLLTKYDGATWHLNVPVTAEQAAPFINKNDRRVICTFNDQERVHCGLMPDGNGHFFININNELRKKLGVDLGDPLELKLEEDNSKYGMPLPKELAEIFAQDEEGNQHFHALSPGKQRSLIYMVSKPKGSDTRIRKTVLIIDYLKSVNGKLDYKELNQYFKDNKGI